ncbi:MAG: metal-dependent transcriptional regulator [Candidatus Glassbacteria bacterium]
MEEKYDEVLESIWTHGERNLGERISITDLREQFGNESLFTVLEENELIRKDGDYVELTERGQERAESLVRNHRLAERLLNELFKLEDPELEDTACKFEHILSPRVTESVCTFLGHPPVCPHGRRIPPGVCCRKGTKKLKPLVCPLQDLGLGRSAKIVFITPSVQTRLSRLSSIGIMPGAEIKLLQKRPSVVLQIDETTIALETDIAKEIFIRED